MPEERDSVVFPTGGTAESFLFRENIYETYENRRKQLEYAWKFVIILPVFG